MLDVIESQQLWMHLYAVLVANSILIYDHMATLPEEIIFIWRRPKALSAKLFLVNRYIALLGNIFALCVDFLPISDERFQFWFLHICYFAQQRLSCVKYTLCRQLFFLSQGIIVCLILTIRIYALYGCNKRLLTCMIIVGFTLVAGACAGAIGHFSSNATIFPGVGCYETYTVAVAARVGLSWVALFIFELLIFILTVYRICKPRGLRLSLFTRSNIVDIMFHDGAMYFRAMTLINIPNILTYYSSSVDNRGSLATFTSSMSATLISRLVLNLHASMDTGILSTTVRGDSASFALTTRVNVQSAISSHHW
ncbi:hypothetical protein DFJ58DRAFT_744833 [Suillus subalutaceus]|uniref:uncharacterized protein n=1 Tax=Suillus subalutaceus TaxID=48586 RepID=UPI001B879605|nr:uncharacterized protein DFJ58DRAFT_744833 [Suillus subalutaceus]KAG1858790.1 hypothetical protein DFJ58DRAFT_744833 [Suillus subalutaceus]